MAQIEKDYIETGKVRYVFLDFPLETIHKKAFKAHEAANCSGDQGKYWEMHDLIFENQTKLDPKDFIQHAETLGLDMVKFEECMNSGKYIKEIRKDMSEGRKAGATGTPTTLLGYIEQNGTKVRAVKLIKGAAPYDQYKEEIEKLLNPPKKKKE